MDFVYLIIYDLDCECKKYQMSDFVLNSIVHLMISIRNDFESHNDNILTSVHACQIYKMKHP